MPSLGIPEATNGMAVSLKVAVAVDTLIVVAQVPDPCAGIIGRGTPPDTEFSSAHE